MKYTMEDFKTKKIAVTFANADEQKRFLQECEKAGLRWGSWMNATAPRAMPSFHHPVTYTYGAPCLSHWIDETNETAVEIAKRDGFTIVPFSAFTFSSPRHEIHITSDGLSTHAVYKLDGKIIKRTQAKCNPNDVYSFQKGAELAFGRLLDKPAPLEITCGFGDILVGVRESDNKLRIYKSDKAYLIGMVTKGSPDEKLLLTVDFTKPESVASWIHQLRVISRKMHKKPAPQPEYYEVKRVAKVGEKIKIVAAENSFGAYKNGDTLEVKDVEPYGVRVLPVRPGDFDYIYHREYVVLVPRARKQKEETK